MTAASKVKPRPAATTEPTKAPASTALAPVSPAKIRANRANAALSTGPRSPEGKRIARWNAMRHGVLSSSCVLPDESGADFAALRDHLRADLRPVGAVEELLTDRIVSFAWRLRRLGRVEGEILRWAKAEAERIRHHGLARQEWEDEKRRAQAALKGERRTFKYQDTHTESGRKRRKPVERIGFHPVPAVGDLEYSFEIGSAARISTLTKDEKEGLDNYREADKCLRYGAIKAADEQEKADKCARYERDSDETALGRAFMLDQTDKALDKLTRYETTTDRAMRRTLEQLLQLQASRGAGGVVLDAGGDGTE